MHPTDHRSTGVEYTSAPSKISGALQKEESEEKRRGDRTDDLPVPKRHDKLGHPPNTNRITETSC